MNTVHARRERAAVQCRCHRGGTGAEFLADLESAALATQLNTAYLGIVAEMRAEGGWEVMPADLAMSNALRRFFKLQEQIEAKKGSDRC